jgi:hypothetical protein
MSSKLLLISPYTQEYIIIKKIQLNIYELSQPGRTNQGRPHQHEHKNFRRIVQVQRSPFYNNTARPISTAYTESRQLVPGLTAHAPFVVTSARLPPGPGASAEVDGASDIGAGGLFAGAGAGAFVFFFGGGGDGFFLLGAGAGASTAFGGGAATGTSAGGGCEGASTGAGGAMAGGGRDGGGCGGGTAATTLDRGDGGGAVDLLVGAGTGGETTDIVGGGVAGTAVGGAG